MCVQVSYFGYPGSIGKSLIDYNFCDKIACSTDFANSLFTEKLVLLPQTYFFMSFEALRWRQDPVFTEWNAETRHQVRQAEGLPSEGVVFANFNRFNKLDPLTLKVCIQRFKTKKKVFEIAEF